MSLSFFNFLTSLKHYFQNFTKAQVFNHNLKPKFSLKYDAEIYMQNQQRSFLKQNIPSY